MLKMIASGWEKTFARRLPMVMANFSRNAATPLRKFHRDIEARARKIGSSIAGLSMLSHQVGTYESILKDFSTTIKDLVNSTQRDINREFTPVIERAVSLGFIRPIPQHVEGMLIMVSLRCSLHTMCVLMSEVSPCY